MFVIAAAVLVVIAQAYARQATKDKATVARRRAAGLPEAKAQAEDAARVALDELERIRIEAAEQLAACRVSAEQAEAAARAARAELEQVRDVAAKAVSDMQQAVQAAIQQAITDQDRILVERVADPGQQTEKVKADASAKINTKENQIGTTEAMHEPLVKTVELEDAPGAGNHEQLDEAVVAQQLAQTKTTTTRPHGVSARRILKMTPALVDKAQRMYDSGNYTVAEIAESFDVSPTTIYRYLRTRGTMTR
jgi:helix-turn-helix resolvase-like protein